MFCCRNGTTSEFFDGDSFYPGPSLPADFSQHCAVEFDGGRVFLASADSQWIADLPEDDEATWTRLSPMTQGRSYAACGRAPFAG